MFIPGGLAWRKGHDRFTPLEVRRKWERFSVLKQEVVDLFKQIKQESKDEINRLMMKAEVQWSIPGKFTDGDEAEFYILLNSIGSIIHSF